MSTTRIFDSSQFLQPTEGEPIRSVVTESKDAVVVAWYVKPGQTILPHVHPHGQDTWTILSGKGEYYLDQVGTTQPIIAGDIVVAFMGCVHGVINNGEEPLVFISVVSPSDAGYYLVSLSERPDQNTAIAWDC
ncbi:cupin domain-containing protein [Trichocoleus desertorum]|uniref:cupin domain-containing protein n=1 Tax=Trichocoleus desertorum TaxID=1481672 RepID=UPI003298B35C